MATTNLNTVLSGLYNNDVLLKTKLADLSGHVKDSFVENKIAVGTATGLTSSNLVLGSDDTLSTAFGTANTVATEVAAKKYVDGKVAALQGDALTGIIDTASITGTVSENKLSASVKVDGSTIAIDATNGLKSVVKLTKLSTAETGFAASYQLTDKDGTALAGDTINIPKDQFLSGAAYNATNETLDLTFAIKGEGAAEIASTVSVPVGDLVHEYIGSDAITVASSVAGSTPISLKLDTSTVGTECGAGQFLSITTDGLLLSGVQDAINAKAADATAGLTALSAALSGYTGANAVSTEFTTVDGRLDTLEAALTDYTGADAVKTKFGEVEEKLGDAGTTGHTGEIFIADASGNLDLAGVTIGGATLDASPLSTKVATEAAVAAAVSNSISGLTTDQVVFAASENSVKTTGYVAGSDSQTATAFGTADTTLATEKAVKAFVEEGLSDLLTAIQTLSGQINAL